VNAGILVLPDTDEETTLVSHSVARRLRRLGATSRLGSNVTVDDYGCAALLLNGPDNSTAIVAVGASLADGAAPNSGGVYLKSLSVPPYKEIGSELVTNGAVEEFTFFTVKAVGIFFGLLVAVTVPSALVVGVLIYKFRIADINSNASAKASLIDLPSVPENDEIELGVIPSKPSHATKRDYNMLI